ncbi:hypothetical protein BDK51DRAFT_30064 [Blyttiomyces helicus]|uniref:CCDC43 PWI-like domain-containing protein n=1 Tax=Blyttiomyces helicus TaxID=388810 RepID=A0A4P9WP50_9FUNG|nr:hypothetical protein BDK51DRAFT_30064 [Blyttiomyces helicus]|eukprot:RKO93000.1 hypothetical protein BDK51DRAFT_30064 [Blyttiomyces helicus]
MTVESDWEEWLTSALLSLKIEDEAFSEYISQICSEDSIEDDEKREVISEFLSEATEESVTETVDEILRRTEVRRAKTKAEEEEARVKALEAVKVKELESLREFTSGNVENPKKRVLSKDEQIIRARLLQEYAYEMEEVEENGEVEVIKDGDASGSIDGDPLLSKNRNAEVVKEAEQAKRLASQAEHAKVAARNKEMQEKQRLEREKEKKRAPKKEKRRM